MEIRAQRNERHSLKCREVEALAKFIRRIDPTRLLLVVDGKGGKGFEKMKEFCDAVLGKSFLGYSDVVLKQSFYLEK